MIKLLKKSKLFLIFVISINISSLVASELTHIPINQEQIQSSFANKGSIIKQLYNEDGLLMYDSVMRLIEEIEKGYLEDICTEEDWYEINHFLAFLARLGTMPSASDEEKAELEKDIQKLLNLNEYFPIIENSYFKVDNLTILPAVDYGKANVILCKNWFIKQCNKVGHFVEDHKKAIIIGTVAVVAVTAVVITAVSVTAAATATAATAASLDSSESGSPVKESTPLNNESVLSNNSPSQSSEINSGSIITESLPQYFENEILNYKNFINENNLTSKPSDQNFPSDNEKYIGSTFAHETFQNFPNNLNIPNKTYEDIIAQGHGKIDEAFATNQTPLYLDNNSSFNTSKKSFQENYFYMQGKQALKDNYYDKAINSFGKAIEVNPNNYNIYLDRAYAHLQNGQFDQSLNDYQVYTNQTQANIEQSTPFIDCFDFSVGVTTGITKGAFESGRQLMSFAANAVTHPVKTYSSFINSIQMISDLAKDNEWQTLSKILFPEVSELVNNWDSFTPKEKGEKSGYIIGKYGADILIPGAAAKAVSQGIKGAKELVVIAKNIQRTEELIALEALAGTGGCSGTFAETVYAWKAAEEIVPHSSGILRNIRVFSSITTKNDILKIIKPNGQWTGKAGAKPYIRLFEGGQKESINIFNKLTKNAKTINNTSYPGKMFILEDGTIIGFRSLSKSGPPTIDIKLPDIKDNIKLKFLENN